MTNDDSGSLDKTVRLWDDEVLIEEHDGNLKQVGNVFDYIGEETIKVIIQEI